MHPTTVTMMISVFRGPSVPPFGSLGRLLAVVAIVLDGSSSCFGNFQTDDFHYYFLCCFFIDPTVGKMQFASRSLVNAFRGENFQFSPPFLLLAGVSTIFTLYFLFAHHWPKWLGGCFLVHSIQPFYFVSLSSCNHVLLWFLANDYYINSGCGKTVWTYFLYFGHILALHLISHDHFAFLLSIHLLLQSVLVCYANDFCYFRFSLFARLKKNHFYRIGVKIEKNGYDFTSVIECHCHYQSSNSIHCILKHLKQFEFENETYASADMKKTITYIFNLPVSINNT